MPCADDHSPLVVLQARTGSRRLPGKALLDFHGLPLVVLSAKRAANKGANVVVATSDEATDDALVRSLRRHNITVVRGPLDDVLGRFIIALGEVPDAAPVVRLTGDNVLPDGSLIVDVVADFERRKLDYITTTDRASGLPFGCAVEVTRAGHLRMAARQASTVYEREHVTPFIRARFGVSVFTSYAVRGGGHLRSTIDCLDDYHALHRATPVTIDLEHYPWQVWVERLKKSPCAPRDEHQVSDLVLGTAQLGMPYGIARRDAPDKAESLDMLRRAIIEGVKYLDTARAYGESEALIGGLHACGWDGRMRVVTKLSPLDDLAPGVAPSEAGARAEASLLHSCLTLRRDRLDCVLLHRMAHFDAWNGAVFKTLESWQAEGRIGTLGVSVQSPNELRMALELGAVGHVQLPCNILDHRWDGMIDAIRGARKDRGLVVHVRSALLQGLLGTVDAELWRRAHVSDSRPLTRWLARKADLLDKDSVVGLCLAWARGLDWADGVVVGCDNMEQLHDTVRLFRQPALTQDEISALAAERPHLAPHSLDPARWQAL